MPAAVTEPEAMCAALARFFEGREELPVVSAYLFGSEARGTAHRDSDVDVAVLLRPEAGHDRARAFDLRVTITSQLIAALHRNQVDVVVLQQVPPLLARAIVIGGRRVFCRDAEADRRFVRDTQLRAADLEPFVQKGRRRLLARLSE
jgi:uncharacterized protein